MPIRQRIAFTCHALVALGLALMGLRYLLARQFLGYHAEVAGQTWSQLEPGLQRLLLAMLHGSGAATLAGGLALVTLLLGPWRQGARWARHLVPLLALAGLVPLLAIVLGLARTGAAAPWPLVAAAVALSGLGWALSLGGAEPGRGLPGIEGRAKMTANGDR